MERTLLFKSVITVVNMKPAKNPPGQVLRPPEAVKTAPPHRADESFDSGRKMWIFSE
jgi:hypothetical protein